MDLEIQTVRGDELADPLCDVGDEVRPPGALLNEVLIHRLVSALNVGECAGPFQLDSDPHRAAQQCLFLLGNEINRLRNEPDTGHGRPGPSRKTAPLTPAEARLIVRSTALLARCSGLCNEHSIHRFKTPGGHPCVPCIQHKLCDSDRCIQRQSPVSRKRHAPGRLPVADS